VKTIVNNTIDNKHRNTSLHRALAKYRQIEYRRTVLALQHSLSHGHPIARPQALRQLAPDNTPPPTLAYLSARLTDNTLWPALRQCFRSSCLPRTSLRRAERQHGRPRSKLHAPTTSKRKPEPLQRVLRRLPLRTEHERVLRGLPRSMIHLEAQEQPRTQNHTNTTALQAPTPQSFARAKTFTSPNSKHHSDRHMPTQHAPPDVDATFLTTDTSFVEHPPTTSKPPSRYSSVPSARTPARGSTRGGAPAQSASRGARGSGIARGGMTGTGTARGTRGGVARGVGRGRGTTTGIR
jgi:hypothetical protein